MCTEKISGLQSFGSSPLPVGTTLTTGGSVGIVAPAQIPNVDALGAVLLAKTVSGMRKRDWRTGEGFTNGLTAADLGYIAGVVREAEQAAYQRGREDAERDVFAAEALPFSNLLPRGVAAAAARGDGE